VSLAKSSESRSNRCQRLQPEAANVSGMICMVSVFNKKIFSGIHVELVS
jgi:hypothetical protein